MKKSFHILMILLGWFAITAQFFLMFENRTISITEMTIRFFSYFTILTNILVALYFTYQAIAKKNEKHIFNRPATLTAITVYITVVGLVYQVVLRNAWQPTGLQKIVDELLHTIIPVLVIIYWLLYEQKSVLRHRIMAKFLLYPLMYLTFILVRGQLSGFYPYPFINVSELGWSQSLINIVALFGVFFILAIFYVGGGKLISKMNYK